MKKILVTTDFSVNSKAGIKFAIQVASQAKMKLTFFHSYYILKPTTWSREKFQKYETGETEKLQKRFKKFVEAEYRIMNIPFKNIELVLEQGVSAYSKICDYAKRNQFDFVCISTRGAGKIKKIFGTNTSNVIKNSGVPTISVPSNYKVQPISSILYASDLNDVDDELRKVIQFNKYVKAKIELLHFEFPSDFDVKHKIMTAALKKYSTHKIDLRLENLNVVNSFITNIESVVKKSKPSLLVMFKHPRKNIFERIFFSSYSAEFSFSSKVPLLVFQK